ncbi:SDR family oxidoreductase [Streptomyces cocklensis]|jgi:NAD(P)-dependent dehydrogenase (short-subunit alcohol dehydrogenase family)|uniref:NAD(P)-dependent dehydrogenase, short-chain alcohol dehydrogenase family n=1 Tax=Actinacidiphila cocklensis TaxID=887465 RepID=A0A9W4E401_9ACTN|nr:SDR family oxidoreductase [Actinacidiphila cocklensis]MDD1058874.1 SDR family oxidoreductase [Actinacidiphila cocklensis]CAG6399007.1 NAD(P)-dependent dehydrogenase, short-chain alcohol dehydrogenase family [Actinacidiphila cocklensis]
MESARKVAVVTGASGGIGTALVTAYRGLGYAVVATARSIEASDDPEVLAVSADVAEPGAGARVVEAAMDRFGRIDTLVNSAGIFVAKPFTEYTDEDFEAVVGVNVRGFFGVARGAIAAMLSRGGGGHVVSISTSLVDNADANVASGLTALTKGGLNAVTRSLAIEYATRGIRVNAVSLGVIRTPMHPDDPGGTQAARHPVRRMGEVEDVVQAIRYLEQAPFVTGEIAHVDGGQSAGH